MSGWPRGFRFGATASGIKGGGDDLALVVSEVRATAAGCLTQNRARASSIDWLAARLPTDDARAIVVNSGNANCLTGRKGADDNRAMASAVAMAMGAPIDAILTCSTGVIGEPLPVEKIIAATPRLYEERTDDPTRFSKAILTTDLRTKIVLRGPVDGPGARMLGIAKGSGMIHPNMATMLGFVVTDARITPTALSAMLRRAVDDSFNMITVDGDTSTNDAVIVLANGLADEPLIDDPVGDRGRAFSSMLSECCRELAKEIARDGEGAKRLIAAHVEGAETERVARAVARAMVSSSLVKTALFGADPNWGRILSAVGQAAAELDLALDVAKLRLSLQGVCVFARGAPAAFDATALHRLLDASDVRIELALGAEGAAATAWGCDLSADYVRINADYHAST